MHKKNILLTIVFSVLCILACFQSVITIRGAVRNKRLHEENLYQEIQIDFLKSDIVGLNKTMQKMVAIEEGRGGLDETISIVRIEDIDYLWPMHPDDFVKVTDPFGERTWRDTFHVGADIVGYKKDDYTSGLEWKGYFMARILNVADGTVEQHFLAPGMVVNGRTYHGDKNEGGKIVIRDDDDYLLKFSHLSWTNTAVVKEGKRIKRGALIGRQGNTGALSKGAHLHFTVQDPEGNYINPFWYLAMQLEKLKLEAKKDVLNY
jgi:murein DD-endopeptidase MepM/ murein hydrolase activator NlpD